MTRIKLVWVFIFLLSAGCVSIGRPVGTHGQYQAGREALMKPGGREVDQAIVHLEAVAKENPLFQDVLTLLGRAYYVKGRYQESHAILQRALAVNKEDEIAWIVLSLTLLRLGDDQKGLDGLKGGITLFGKASSQSDGYRGFPSWDLRGVVRGTLNRTAFQIQKGGEKEEIIRSVTALLAAIDSEEHFQVTEKKLARGTVY